MKNETITIEIKNEIIEDLLTDLSKIKPFIDDVLTAFNSLNIGNYPFKSISLSDPEKIVKETLLSKNTTQGEFAISGIKMSKSKMMELIELPKGSSVFYEKVRLLSEHLENYHKFNAVHGLFGSNFLAYFKVENNTAEIDQKAIDNYKRQRAVSLTSEVQINTYKETELFCNAINRYITFNPMHLKHNIINMITPIRTVKFESEGICIPNVDFIAKIQY